MAIFAGCLFGSSFVPVLYMKHNADNPESAFFGASTFGKYNLHSGNFEAELQDRIWSILFRMYTICDKQPSVSF